MDCGRCGSWLDSPRPGDVFFDGDMITCPDCATVNQISVDDDANPEVYVSYWTCRHGIDSDTTCDDCDAEDASSSAGRAGEATTKEGA